MSHIITGSSIPSEAIQGTPKRPFFPKVTRGGLPSFATRAFMPLDIQQFSGSFTLPALGAGASQVISQNIPLPFSPIKIAPSDIAHLSMGHFFTSPAPANVSAGYPSFSFVTVPATTSGNGQLVPNTSYTSFALKLSVPYTCSAVGSPITTITFSGVVFLHGAANNG